MKKIKKKGKVNRVLPAYVIGYTNSEDPAPGFLSAWFNNAYGGPLNIQFTTQAGHSQFEAVHTQWRARVHTDLSSDIVGNWRERLQWGHSQLAEVLPIHQSSGQDKRDSVLHVARIARGLTLLTEGTAYDVVRGSFLNPSDWSDQELDQFVIEDHVRVDQTEQLEQGRAWFYTQGLAKFGLEEIETFCSLGLPERATIDTLLEIGVLLIADNKVVKVGEHFTLPRTSQMVKVIRHRTDQSLGIKLNLREVSWGEV